MPLDRGSPSPSPSWRDGPFRPELKAKVEADFALSPLPTRGAALLPTAKGPVLCQGPSAAPTRLGRGSACFTGSCLGSLHACCGLFSTARFSGWARKGVCCPSVCHQGFFWVWRGPRVASAFCLPPACSSY